MHRDSRPLRREHAEPTEGRGPLSPILILLVGALGFFGLDYLLSTDQTDPFGYGGDTRAAYTPNAVELDGETIFSQRCAACHQTTGLGVAGAFPPLVDSPWVTEDPETVVRILLLGISGPIEVNGNVYNGRMPAFGELSDEEISRVATYVRQSWGNDASAVEVELVEHS